MVLEMENLNNYNKLRIAGIIRESIVDGPGIRFVIFTQGCPNRCPDCHNKQTWDFEGGSLVSINKILKEIDKNPLLKGVTFSGGEPMCQAKVLKKLAKKIKEKNLDLVVFTGYKYEELQEMNNKDINELLNLTDILIDGKFEKDKRDLSLKFRGSRNQRLIDIRKTLKENKVVLIEE